jgi:hypothetical protein
MNDLLGCRRSPSGPPGAAPNKQNMASQKSSSSPLQMTATGGQVRPVPMLQRKLE